MNPGSRTTASLPASLGRGTLVWAVLCGILLLQSLGDIQSRAFRDPDDVLRLVQVRDLLGGQGWLDLRQYRIDAPAGTLMHWSRLVDIPLVLIICALRPLVGQPAAELAALIAVPLLTLGAIVLTVAGLARRFLDRTGVVIACFCVGASPLLLTQMQPLRIDHHGWQIFCAVLATTGLLPGHPVRGSVLAGVALAVGLSISLELLPITLAFGAVLACRWLLDGRDGTPLAAFLVALTGPLALLFLGTRGLADLAQHCDAMAPAHLGALAIVSAVVGGVLRTQPHSRNVLVALLALAVICAIGFYIWAAPRCTAGPFAGLDPLVRHYWYNNVREGRPAWEVPFTLWLPIVAQSVVALGVLAHLSVRAAGAERRWWFEYLVVTAAAFIAGLLVWRSMAFVGALSALPLGWLGARLLKVLRDATTRTRRFGVAAAIILVLIPGFPVALAHGIAQRDTLPEKREGASAASNCELRQSAPALNRLQAGTILAPLDLGPTLLETTHHSVVATNHHRAAAAMHDVIAAFLGSRDRAYQLIRKRQVRFVLICSELSEIGLYAEEAPEGFAADLLKRRAPAWLEPVPIEGSPALRVWRVVDQASLRPA